MQSKQFTGDVVSFQSLACTARPHRKNNSSPSATTRRCTDPRGLSGDRWSSTCTCIAEMGLPRRETGGSVANRMALTKVDDG
jgi:hypothetical protein